MSLLNNPVISREIITHLRVPRHLIGLLMLLVISSLVFCFTYTFIREQVADLSGGGRWLFFPMTYVAMLIGIPIATMSSASIVREREEETLDLMMTTPLSRAAMIGGKVLATLLYSLFFLIALLPFFYFSAIAGGISSDEMTQSLVTLMGFYCAVAVIGTLISLISVSSHAAGRYAVAAVLLLYLGPSVFGAVLSGLIGNSPMVFGLIWLASVINPFYAVLVVQSAGLLGNMASMPGTLAGNPWLVWYSNHAGYIAGGGNILLALLLFFLTSLIFRLFSNRLSVTFSYTELSTGFFSGFKRFLHKNAKNNENNPSTRSMEILPYFSDQTYAVFEKERLLLNRRWLSNGRNVLIGAIVVTALFTGFALTQFIPIMESGSPEFLYYMLCALCTVMVVLFAPINPSFSILVEHQKNTWDMLRTTVIPSRRIILSKILNGVVQTAFPLIGITLTFMATYVFFLFLNGYPLGWETIFQSVVLILYFSALVFFYSCVGVLFSSRATHKKHAPHRGTFIIILFHYIAPFLIYLVMFSFMYFVLDLRTTGARSGLVEVMERYLFPLSPAYLFAQSNWGTSQYTFFLGYSIFLLLIGYILSFAATAEIKKRN